MFQMLLSDAVVAFLDVFDRMREIEGLGSWGLRCVTFALWMGTWWKHVESSCIVWRMGA